jgi:hypothetical protein
MNWKLMFKGDYIAAVEMGDKTPTLTIKGVKLCKLEDDKGRQKDKGIVFFREIDRGWVLCKTNAMCLARMFGDDTNDWTGKRVTLFSTPVQVGKEKQPGIRVKGSPDLAAPMTVEIKLPKKKPFPMRMLVTKPGAAAAAPTPASEAPPEEESTPEPEAESEEITDPVTGEVF